ncbi:MAG: XdhC family protein [Deltaproteobacteria bacterium]|nr:XdhC family protein [Deltaproteobacteria bacterium]
MEHIYFKVVEHLEAGRVSVLATLVRLRGSAPRGIGTQCLVLEDGSLEGTIGGGLLEARVLQEASKVIATRSPLRLAFVLQGKDVAQSGMICGGEADVFLEPLQPGNAQTLAVFRRAVEVLDEGGSGLMALLLDERGWESGAHPRMFLEANGRITGSFPGFEDLAKRCTDAASGLFEKGRAGILSLEDREGQKAEVFLEPLRFAPSLYVFGGGHVARQLVPLAAKVGFRVMVVDDRPDFTDPLDFPGVCDTRCLPFEGALGKLEVGNGDYVVIVTRGHLHDKRVLEQALKTPAAYIGMIGSRRKVSLIFDKLREEGFGEADIKRVHAPIGLDIGAETPEEIAVSIVAELIKVRAGLREAENG